MSFWSSTGKAEIPIGRLVASYPGNTYGSIVYGRGPLFVATLAESIGEAAFNDYLQRYYQNYKWQTVNTTAFEDWFKTCSGKDLGAIFQKWVLP
jgi:aminopeptidase N